MITKKSSHQIYDVLDVARYIIHFHNSNFKNYGIDGLKLQKILFILQGIYLTHKNRPLFKQHFYAWSCGPSILDISEEFIQAFGSLSIPEYAIQYIYVEDDDFFINGVVKPWINPLLEEDMKIVDEVCVFFKPASSTSLLDKIQKYFPCFTERIEERLPIPNTDIKNDYEKMVQELSQKKLRRKNEKENH